MSVGPNDGRFTRHTGTRPRTFSKQGSALSSRFGARVGASWLMQAQYNSVVASFGRQPQRAPQERAVPPRRSMFATQYLAHR